MRSRSTASDRADIRNILDFEQDFPDAAVVKLEQNYRSTGTILDAANAVIAHNVEQKPKRLFTESGRGEAVRVTELADEHEEGRYVAAEIERLVVDEGVPRDQIACFYRVNAQSRVLEDTLVRYEVPYQVIGGTKFYERAEIKDAVAYLSLLANPADAISFQRIVNSPRRGIGDRTQARVLSHANTIGADVWEAFSMPHAIPSLGPGAVKALDRFAQTMASLRDRAEDDGPLAELLEAVLSESGYLEALEAEARGDVTAEARIDNLSELIGVAREFDANREVEGPQRDRPLEEFLAQISLLSDQDALARLGGPGDADDPSQRQGPGVRHGVPDRLRGGPLPAFALDGGGQPRRGAAPLLRRDHPCPRAPVRHVCPPAANLRHGRLRAAVAVCARDSGGACGAALDGAGDRLGTRRDVRQRELRRHRRHRHVPARAQRRGARSAAPATTSCTPASGRVW